jgi:hypothetical protein
VYDRHYVKPASADFGWTGSGSLLQQDELQRLAAWLLHPEEP